MKTPTKPRQIEPTKLAITPEVLNELNRLALSCPTDLSRLSYREIQQSLTLYSLLRYFEERGLDLPYTLDFYNHGTAATASNEKDDD